MLIQHRCFGVPLSSGMNTIHSNLTGEPSPAGRAVVVQTFEGTQTPDHVLHPQLPLFP